MSDTSDEALFIAFREGDSDALEVLLNRIKTPLYRTILRTVGDKFLAEDIFQETVERIIKNKHRYNSTMPFRGWVWKIAYNRSLDHLRKRGRDIPYDDGISGQVISEGNPEVSAIKNERKAKLLKAIQTLPDEQREVFLMREECEMSFAEISKTLNAPLGTVLSRMRYALEKLREALKE